MDQNKLHDLLNYNPETGVFVWKIRPSQAVKEGDIAGHNRSEGKVEGLKYVEIRFKGVAYQAHRLAWLYVHGEFPDGEIDHIDGNGLNNRIDNLRVVSRSVNAKNLSRFKTNKSGATGVIWNKKSRKWQVNIQRKYLGLYESFDEAVIVRKNAECNLGFHLNHGRY